MSRLLLNLFVFVCCVFVVFSFVYTKNYLPGEMYREKRASSEFTSLQVSLPIKVFLRQSDTVSLELKGPKDLIQEVITDVTLEKLSIRGKDSKVPKGIEQVEVYVSVPKIENISLDSAGKIQGKGEFSIKTLNVSAKGGGHIVLSLNGGSVFASIEGSSEMLLIGVVDQETVHLKGSSKLEAASLLAQNASVKLEGSGEVFVNVMQNLSVEIEGSGVVRYGGEPTLNKKISGDGQVIPL